MQNAIVILASAVLVGDIIDLGNGNAARVTSTERFPLTGDITIRYEGTGLPLSLARYSRPVDIEQGWTTEPTDTQRGWTSRKDSNKVRVFR